MDEILRNPVIRRMRITIRGAVQGVGFRPFIYRLATGLGLTGWVSNSWQGVTIEAEGIREHLEAFLSRIESEKPVQTFIQSLEPSFLDPVDYVRFEIRESETKGEKSVLVLPDIATCADCLREILDPMNRRYRYPFTNCTHCGPRYSILEALPYDRVHTTMKRFVMCKACRTEYEDPANRRFHAQPNACPECGPRLEWWEGKSRLKAKDEEALKKAVEAIQSGKIVALKGLGGFHLLVDAQNQEAVEELRNRKHREEKPFAMMYPSLGLIKDHCEVSGLEQRLLLSPEAPIVLLRKRLPDIASSVAPRNPYLGIMLPYTPLHHLLLRELKKPLVATSGNLADEPICIDEQEAVFRLGEIADFFLVHDRPIARHVDDSIVRTVGGREQILRRARGYAPLPITLKTNLPPLLAVGAHLKNTIAISHSRQVVISQHIGDLETPQAFDAFKKVIRNLNCLYESESQRIACDLHPDYLSTRFAESIGLPVTRVQHHYAHILSCMAENELEPPVLGVAWDGTGYGLDGTIWGGEFLMVDHSSFYRIASLRTFPLPGGEQAVREPRRTALAILYEIFGEEIFEWDDLPCVHGFTSYERSLLRKMLSRSLSATATSSMGRLFDAVSSILGICQRSKFEGQAAMELEFIADSDTQGHYPFRIAGFPKKSSLVNGRLKFPKYVIDWAPMIRSLLQDKQANTLLGLISAKFHNTLVEMMIAIAERSGEEKVVLSGGCFQNKYLTERSIDRLRGKGFSPYWHQRVPPNDGGIALGQLAAAYRQP